MVMKTFVKSFGIVCVCLCCLFMQISTVQAESIQVPSDRLYLLFEGTQNGQYLKSEVTYYFISGSTYRAEMKVSGASNGDIFFTVDAQTRLMWDCYSPQGMSYQNNSHDSGWIIVGGVSVGMIVPISVAGQGDRTFIVDGIQSITAMGKTITCWYLTNTTEGHQYWYDQESGLCIRMVMFGGAYDLTIKEYKIQEEEKEKEGDDDSSPFNINSSILGLISTFLVGIPILVLKKQSRANK